MRAFSKLRHLVLAFSISLLPTMAHAQGQTTYHAVDNSPNPYAMVGDLVVARPVGIVLTALGTAGWVVSLPFTLASGHVEEAAQKLIMGPGATTFVRCLGCRQVGYTWKDIENYRRRQARKEAEEARAAMGAE